MTLRFSFSMVAMMATGTALASAQTKVTVGGFVDVHYAFDFGRPRNFDRAFTTQPARHNEFNLNLGYLEAKLDGDGVRGRFALQAGTSVQSNYAAEPTNGTVSGPTLSRHIQEATVGIRLTPTLWIDGGVFLSHIGSEGWISRDNPTYTRSLMADYTPYYQAGVKLTWSPTATVTAQLDVVNGWQIVSENNDAKSIGARIDWAASRRLTISVYNLIGNEMPSDAESLTRIFQGVSFKVTPSARGQVIATFDYGMQDRADGSLSSWRAAALIGRIQATARVGLSARIERYDDPDQVIVATGTPDGFRVHGGSIGIDVAPNDRAVWRTELRLFRAGGPIYPNRTGENGLSSRNGFVVTSIGVTF